MTKLARARAIEGFAYGFFERSVANIGHEHGSPGQRLQREPVKLERNANGKKQSYSSDRRQHNGGYGPSLACQLWRRPNR